MPQGLSDEQLKGIANRVVDGETVESLLRRWVPLRVVQEKAKINIRVLMRVRDALLIKPPTPAERARMRRINKANRVSRAKIAAEAQGPVPADQPPVTEAAPPAPELEPPPLPAVKTAFARYTFAVKGRMPAADLRRHVQAIEAALAAIEGQVTADIYVGSVSEGKS